MMSEDPLKLEARTVARCLIGREPTDAERARYADAVCRKASALHGREARLWKRVVAHPWLYSAVDGALSLVRPASPIRHRGYIMLAVLEASTAHTDLFLARPRARPLVVVSVVATALASVVRSLFGLVVIAATR
jgi:hypothetical protein